MSTPKLTFSTQKTRKESIPRNQFPGNRAHNPSSKIIFLTQEQNHFPGNKAHNPSKRIIPSEQNPFPGNRANGPPSRPSIHTSAQPDTANTEAYRHKLTTSHISQPKHYSKKPKGCAEGARLCGPFAVFTFTKKYCAPFARNETQHFFKEFF